MKYFLILSALLLSFHANSQVVTGTIKTLADNEILIGVSILVNNTSIGTNSNATGYFELNLEGRDTIIFSYFGYRPHHIINLQQSKSDTIHLGEIKLCDTGFRGYMTFEKKIPFSKKTRMVCQYVDYTKELTKEERTVKNSKGEVRYIWKKIKKNDALQIDYTEILETKTQNK